MISQIMPFNTTVSNNVGQNSNKVAFKANAASEIADSFVSNTKGEELYSRLVAARLPQETIDEMVEIQREMTASFAKLFGGVLNR